MSFNVIPSGVFPSTNVFGQSIGNLGLVNPLQAWFTVTQGVTNAPVTALGAISSAAGTLLSGAGNAFNQLFLGVAGAPFGTASGVSLSQYGPLPPFALPFPFPLFSGTSAIPQWPGFTNFSPFPFPFFSGVSASAPAIFI